MSEYNITKQAKIIVFCCCYIAGIIIFFSDYPLILSFIILSVLLYMFVKKIYTLRYFLILSFIFLVGFFNSSINLKYSDDLTSYADENITAEAKVISIPSNNKSDKTGFYAKILKVQTEDDSEELCISAKAMVTISGEKENLKKIKIGDTLKFNAKVKTPSNAQNPSQFDYARYLQFKKTFSLLYVNKDEWSIIEHASDITGKSLRKLNDLRNNILNIHAQNIKSPMLEILGGIIFGDDAVNPDENTKTAFINSGIFHILAASGMNVTLIFGIWFFFAVRLKFNYKFSILTGLALILFYTCMTGFGPPIIRASLMLSLILIGKLIDRETPTLALLFIVAFLMLLFNPLMLFDIGFQLSFIVTFALILTAPLLVFNFKYKILSYLLGACMIPLIAQIYAAPLQMYYFNTFTVYSVFANIAIVPVLSIISFAGFISSIIALIPPLAQKVCLAADFILNPFLVYIVKVADFFSTLPFSIIYLKKPSILQILVYFSLVIFITCILRYKLFYKKIYITLSLLLLVFLGTFIQLPDKTAQIMFFSVGNADLIMLKSPENEYFLIDSGKYNYFASNSQAKNTVIKYLRDKGIKNINSLIITHFDSDHAGGTIDILKYLNVKKTYLSDIYENTKLSTSILEYIEENNVKTTTVKDIINIHKEKDFEVFVIRPKGKLIQSENQNSLIVYCKYKKYNLLFMGDGDINSFNVLPDEMKRNITIMKSGHHGATETISDEMALNTQLFVISTGFNTYNHPHPDTIAMINKYNKSYIRTDYSNAINVKLEPEKIKLYFYSPKKRKFIRTFD